MSFKNLHTALVLLLLLVIASCSTQKDGFSYRVYHNTTAHFNGYFNADQSIIKGYKKIVEAYKPDYDNILPMFIIGTEETAKGSFPEMERAIEKSEKVINRHTIKKEANKDKKKPVFNKWIDENYMVIGRSHFYKRNWTKAEQVFRFVNGKYDEKDTQLSSATWLSRTYTEMGEYSKAIQALNRFEPVPENDKKLVADYYMAMADAYLRQGDLVEAAKKLDKAIDYIPKKKDKARPHFILAQIYQRSNRSSDALTHFDAVIRSRPPYELEFYAKINKALSFSRRGGSSDQIKKELMRMLKDEKNENYLDQIYFALGDLALEEQNRETAIFYFEESLKASVSNKKMRAKTFLRLADLYFDQRQYKDAQLAYDSTSKNMSIDHPRYREVKARAESLNELVLYLDKIQLTDSLNKLCSMSEIERERALRKAVKDAERAAEERRIRDEELAAQAQNNATATVTGGNFWAYNPTLREKGQRSFKEYWGERPLKDNWRLASRLSRDFGSPDESIVVVNTPGQPQETAEDRYKVPSLDELRSTLPCADDKQMQKNLVDLAEAYYRAGVIYKENLDDPDNALDTWEQCVLNIEESDFHPMTYYQLYRTWLYKEQLAGYKKNPLCETCASAYWAQEVKNRYPGSDWAKLIDNPEYLDAQDEKNKREVAAYQEVYNLFAQRNYTEVLGACNKVLAEEPDNHLQCKYKLLRALSIGYTDGSLGIRENFIAELNAIKASCAGTEEADRATEILKNINKEAGIVENNSGGNNTSGNNESNVGTPQPEVSFKTDMNGEFYVAVILPVQGTDMTKAKSSLTDYNATNYSSSGYKVTNNLLDKNNHIVLVKPFQGAALAMEYLNTLSGEEKVMNDLGNADRITFVISKANYITLFKNKNLDAYVQFYNENF